jgi:hypothetical protein
MLVSDAGYVSANKFTVRVGLWWTEDVSRPVESRCKTAVCEHVRDIIAFAANAQ